MLTAVNTKPKVFISFATPDFEMVRTVANAMQPHLEPRFWHEFQTPGEMAWKTIFQEIDGCDYVIAIITDSTLKRAMAVGQEIGRAKTKGKVIIPLVAKGIKETDLGCLCGVTYVRIDPQQPALMVSQIETLTKQIVEHKSRRDQRSLITMLALVVGGVVALSNMDDE